MEQDAKIRALARSLIGKHGREACNVAHKRAAEQLRQRRYDEAALWAATAHAVTHLGAPPKRAVSPEPPLTDLLRDPVTHAVMKRDGIATEEITTVIKRVKGKLGG
jgi:hypothetical protein